MKNKYKVVALVPLEFSVEGSSDSKEAIESVKNIFEACRDDNDCADIVFDGIEESLRHDRIEANMKGTSVERRQRLYNSYISDRPIQHQLTEYGLIAPDGTWYACEFGEHAALAGRIIMRNREAFGLSDHEVLNMAYDWSGKGLDFLYKRGWIAIRNPSMGNTFLDMDETKTATKAQVNTIFDYISKFNRYDMNISKVMVD